MSSYGLSQRADADLDSIYEYSVEQFGLQQAHRYREELESCFAMLADHPRIGRTSDTVRRGLRRHEHGSHVILYREEREHILIIAVVHGRSMRGLKQ